MTARISVVMIVKNEIDRLQAGLESFASLGHLLHEVCIYDTGSTDGSIELARSYGAKVEEGYWDDDFARARNCAAAMATGDWLLVVDADEQVRCDPIALEHALTNTRTQPDGFFVMATIDPSQVSADDSWSSARLYNPTRLRYYRPVHTELRRPDGSQMDLQSIPEAALSLLNGGFDRDRMVRSVALKDRLTTTLIENTPEGKLDYQALTDRGRARMGQGRYEEAIEDLVAADTGDVSALRAYHFWNKELLILALLHVGDTQRADSVLSSLEDLQPHRSYTRWLRGQIRATQGRHEEAFGEWAQINGAIDGGLTPLDLHTLYVSALREAIALESPEKIIACLLALVGMQDSTVSHAPLLARLWGSRPTAPLCRALAICGDRPLDWIVEDLIAQDGAAAALGLRMREFLKLAEY